MRIIFDNIVNICKNNQVEPRVQQPDLMFPSLVEPLVEPVQEEEEELAAYSEVGLPKIVFVFVTSL